MTGSRVLIVDDASLVRLYYRDALSGAGYTVDEALNGLEALEKLLLAPADLIVLDVNMPKMDGMTFLRVLRRHALPLAATPVLVSSTEAAPRDAALARAAGANFYLVKPVARERFLAHVALLCGPPSRAGLCGPPSRAGLCGPPSRAGVCEAPATAGPGDARSRTGSP